MRGGGRAVSRLIKKYMCQSNRSQLNPRKQSVNGDTAERLIANNVTGHLTDTTHPNQPTVTSVTHQIQSGSQESTSTSFPRTSKSNNASISAADPATIPTNQPIIDQNNNEIPPIAPSLTANLASDPPLKVIVSPVRGPITVLDTVKDANVIYTDASVQPGHRGIGIYFGKSHPLNLSRKLPRSGRSSVHCEIIAAKVALQNLKVWSQYNRGPVILRTDCYEIIQSMQNEEMTSTYAEDLKALKKLAMEFPKGVQFEHVYGHTGNPGNEAADKLAHESSSGQVHRTRSRSRRPSPKMLRRTRTTYMKRKRDRDTEREKSRKVLLQENTNVTDSIVTGPVIPPNILKRDAKQEKQVEKIKDKSLKVEKTQEASGAVAERDREKGQGLVTAKSSTARFLKRLKVDLTPVTPPTGRNDTIDGRPLTWAPKKKKQKRKSEEQDRVFTPKEYNEHVQKKLENIEKLYASEQKQLLEAVEEIIRDKSKAKILKSVVKRKKSKSRRRKSRKRKGRDDMVDSKDKDEKSRKSKRD